MRIPVIIEVGAKPTEENYSCYIPDIPGCITVGDTFEETIQNIREALDLYFEGGTPLPSISPLEKIVKHMRDGDILATIQVEISLQKNKAA